MQKFRQRDEEFRWQNTERLAYKPDGTHFRDITRQILLGPEHGLPIEVRYFEIGPDGHSTLERHRHVHAVIVIRGSGQVLLGDRVESVDLLDTVYIAPLTWHQFRANRGEALGFLCLVDCTRDRPERPGDEQVEELRHTPAVADFIRI
ncbi:MAG: cupin domain-containing protein [Rhodothermales bacterium]